MKNISSHTNQGREQPANYGMRKFAGRIIWCQRLAGIDSVGLEDLEGGISLRFDLSLLAGRVRSKNVKDMNFGKV